MIGITVSADQLRVAPIEVRRWVEAEVASALGFQGLPASGEQKADGLAICSLDEVGAVFSLIQGVVPAVNVFFELGHQGVSVGDGALEAYRLTDLLRHARLRSVEQLVALLDMINGALQRVRGSAGGSLYGLDGRGHCFVAAQTRQSISDLWKRLIEADGAAPTEPAAPAEGGAGERSSANVRAAAESAEAAAQ